MFMTSRDLVRRWYGQVKGQPAAVAKAMRSLVAHTIIPTADRSSFGEASFVPLSGCIDLIMHPEINTVDEVAGLIIRGYRASYDPEYNEMLLGGSNNCLFMKDLRQRPWRGAKNRTMIDSECEPALLLTALEMEAEREAVMRRRPMARWPRLAPPVLSFITEKAPKFEATEGLRRLALYHLQPDSVPIRNMCVPTGYRGKVNRIVRDMSHGITLVELEDKPGFDPINLVVEVPTWGQVYVKQGQDVTAGQELAGMTLPHRVLEPLHKANRSLDSLWNAVVDNIGEADASMMLHKLWDSEVSMWAGMVMVPNHILTDDQAQQACAVWRDVRDSIGRICHSHRNPSHIIRSGPREGKISVWDIKDDILENALTFQMAFGEVDLYSLPESEITTTVMNASEIAAVA